jgi:homoserine dehydrogenase
MIKYAILGYGTVGSGVAEVMAEQAEKIQGLVGEPVELKYVLVRHDYPGDVNADKMVMNFSIIEQDPEVSIVVETIGGIGDAYDYSKRALLAGKSVVSSNKELVAVHGAELNELARAKGVNYLFEGSVGGGIPILRPLCQCLAANRIDEVFGILNGTTNYILTAMDTQGQSFDEALKKAQELGYAEADPTADVEGIDACRKTAILADLSFGYNVDALSIPTQGITKLTPADLELAHALGYSIKLLGHAIRREGGCCAFVEPHLIPEEHLLASVNGVMNACVVRGSAVGEVMFYGPGAGKRPTASAVAADIVDAAQHRQVRKDTDLGRPGGVLGSVEALESAWYVRASAAPDMVMAFFPGANPIYGQSRECGFITQPMTRQALADKLTAIEAKAAYRVLA